MRALLEEWRARGFGLEEPLDPDLALASTLALLTYVSRPDLAEELFFHMRALEDLSASATDPDLALALARGWLALTAPQAASIELPELFESLRFALRAAEAIDPRDERDYVGCLLALELHERLIGTGRLDPAADMLEDALASFSDDLGIRPYILVRLADERRVQSDWRAWAVLAEAERARTRLAEAAPKQDLSDLERRLASVRCRLELACGLLDQAVVSLVRERTAVAAGAKDSDSRLGLLQDETGVAIASTQPVLLRNAGDTLDAALEEMGLFHDEPAARAQVLACRASIEDMQADVRRDPGVPMSQDPVADRAERVADERRVDAWLARALAEPALDPTHRAELALRRVMRALRARELGVAEQRLADFPVAGVPLELASALDAARALLALAQEKPRSELEQHERRVLADFQSFLEAKRASPEREGGFGFQSWRNRRLLLGARVDLALALGGDRAEEAAIEALLPEQALGSLARRLGCEAGSLARVRAELLGADRGLLLYLPAGEGIHLFVVDATTCRHEFLDWRYEYESLPGELQAALAGSPARLSDAERARTKGEIEALEAEGARRLLPSSARAGLARWSGVYVVGADLLGGIPFECLPFEDQPLGSRLALATLPSLPVGLELARRSAEETARGELVLLLVAAPENDAQYGEPLPFPERTRDALTSAFRTKTVLSGAEASLERLLGELARTRPAVLNLLVHGDNDPYRELSAGLVLAPGASATDGRVWCEELYARDFRSPPLVVLSACGSARGPRRLGDDGPAQLGGVFLSHGARCTLQAASELALEPTVALLADFDRGIADALSPAEAMRAARAKLARVPRFDHPFYLQSLRVVGLGFQPLVER